MTGTTKEYENLLGNLENTGIVAAGAVNQEGKTSDFVHPEVADVTDSDTSKYSLQPAMLQQEENHYIFKNAVTTYFDYSEIFEGDVLWKRLKSYPPSLRFARTWWRISSN
jgi:hypothetical protein